MSEDKLLSQEMCCDWKFQGKQKDLKHFLSGKGKFNSTLNVPKQSGG